MGFEFKMSGDWFPETPETFAELQSLAHDEPEIWDAICDPRQNDWRQFLEHVDKCGEEYRVGLLKQICNDSPNACGGLLMRILKADEAELRSEELKKEIDQEEEKQKQRAKEEAEAKVFEDALRNGTCLETGICRTITLPGGATMKMIYCPPGEFIMGSPVSEAGRDYGEVQHRVTLTMGFWLGLCEVTQEQWKSVMGSAQSYWKGDNLPVEAFRGKTARNSLTRSTSSSSVKHAFPRKRSGSMHAARGQRQPTSGGTPSTATGRTVMATTHAERIRRARTLREPRQQVGMHPTRGDFITCTEMYWNGVTIGMAIIRQAAWQIRKALPRAMNVCCAPAAGFSTRGPVALRNASGSVPAPAFSTLASASVAPQTCVRKSGHRQE